MSASLYNNYEKGDAMYYEVYIDSVFFLNLVMNFYVLLLTNYSTLRTASWKRIILGAACGALFCIMPFLGNGYIGVKLCVSCILGTIIMIVVAFPIKSLQGFFTILKKMLCYSFLLGGVILFLIRQIPMLRPFLTGIIGIMGVGACVCIIVLIGRQRSEKKRNKSVCRATLIQKSSQMTVTALIDSGNSLVEPISGKPVCIIEQSLFDSLWRGGDYLYRIVPYHSIGKNHGVLQGYLLSELKLDMGGMVKSFQNVYVAVCQERIRDGIKMLVNPMLFQKC